MTARRRLATLLCVLAVLLSGLAFFAPAAQADEEPVDLSSVEAIKAYLEAKGIDTSSALVQEASYNFAGPALSCPAEPYTCAEPLPGQPVIQVTSTGSNWFDVSGPDQCVVVQTTTDGDNSATCTQGTSPSGSVRSSITQQTENGLNGATADQSSSQTEGDTQTYAFNADVHQQIFNKGAGANSLSVYQNAYQTMSGSAPVTQTQVHTQKATADQFSATGDNSAYVDQYLYQHETATGTTGIVQNQNAGLEEEYTQNAVHQVSDSGANGSTVYVTTNQRAEINPAGEESLAASANSFGPSSVEDPDATQVQGCGPCGIIGSLRQSSDGISTATANMDEYQRIEANDVATASQTQYGPVGVPVPTNDMPSVPSPVNGIRCCSEQIGNEGNFFDISLSSEQIGPSAEQFNYVRAGCVTDGTCAATTTVTQDGSPETETCVGSNCDIGILCTEANGCLHGDTGEPETALTNAPPPSSTSETSTFEFTSNEPGGFICALDEGAWEACSSPKTYDAILDGEHLFRVAAVDIAGNIDQTPAEYVYTILGAPDTIIDTQPPDFTNSSEATLTFHATEEATFECKLDGAAFEACTSPQTYTGLGSGIHYVQVRALDAIGNIDASPDSAAWIIDFVAPASTFTTRDGAVKVGDPLGRGTVDGTARDDVSGIDHVLIEFETLGITTTSRDATLTCNINRTNCTWKISVFGIPPGRYTVTKMAFDRAGNHDASTMITIIVI